MSYTASELKLKVDKFVIVLVGSPRGVSTRTWVRNVPEQIRYTLDNRSTVTNKNRYNRERLGHHPDNRPELHICCVTGEYDSSDRYFEGFDVTPLALCQGLSFIRGFLTATDYWHAFDGTGAQKFGKYFKQWMLDDPDRRALHANITDWQKPITKHNPFKIPESTVMMFLQEQNYTIYDFKGKTTEENLLQSFKTLLTDQWRYEWYEWTPEMVERLRKYAT